jgi:MFS family permease
MLPLHRHAPSHVNALPALASNRLLGFIASSLIGGFLAIFLYEFFGFSVQAVLLWYAINFAIKLPFLVIGAKIFSRTGLTFSMIIGVVGTLLFYWMFYLLDGTLVFNPYFLMGIAIFGSMIESVFYWSPFNIDLAKFTSKKHRGKQIGFFYATQRLLGVIAPIIAGWIIANYSHQLNFFLGLMIAGASIIPLIFVPKFEVAYEFSFLKSFRELFSKRFRPMTISMMASGAENIVGVVIWPIFIYGIFSGDYLNIGAFTAVIIVIGLVFEVFIGKETDKYSAKKLLKIGSGVYALGWVFKGLAQTVMSVFAASTFHSFGSIMLRTPLDTLMYEQAADSGHYIDEYTVLREIALTIGRLFMLLFLVFVTGVFSVSASFFVAAIISLGINQLAKYHTES